MKTYYLSLIILFLSLPLFPQYEYEPSDEHPYGLPNPKAPQQLLDFMPLIGECDCKSVSRKPDQTWAEPIDMKWRFKYIMNGMAVQDETLKTDGGHSGSIRQFIPDSTRWYVHYYSSGAPSVSLPTWEGNKNGDGNIVLYRDQQAPNGMDGFYRITFSDMDTDGFKWVGEWVSKDESVVYPTWEIDCTRQTLKDSSQEKQKIMDASKKFSQAYIDGDYETMANAYTLDGKIFPNNTQIIEGREAIRKRWELPEGFQTLHHEINPEEIKFIGDYAYDYGYYNGQTKNQDNTVSEWQGKYVVIWKKTADDWKMYLDIWNNVAKE